MALYKFRIIIIIIIIIIIKRQNEHIQLRQYKRIEHNIQYGTNCLNI